MKHPFKVLYAEDYEELREVYSITIEAELNAELIGFGSGNELIDYLKNHQDVSLVLSDHEMPNGNGNDVYDYIQKNGLKIPFGLLSEDSPTFLKKFEHFYQDHPLNFSLIKPFNVRDLLRNISKVIGASEWNVSSEFVPMNVIYFEKINPLVVDVFEKTDGLHHLKFSKGETMPETYFQKHQKKNWEYFYVPREQYEDLIESILVNLKDHPAHDVGTVSESELKGLALVHQFADQLGIDQKTIRLVDALYDSILFNFKKSNNELSSLLDKVVGKNGYLLEHSLLVSYLSCGIAEKTGWNTDVFYQKLITAGLLHDLGLDDDLSKINSYAQIIEQQINWSDSKKVTEHPQVIFELVNKIGGISSDVAQIILSHHERPDGKGFPKALSSTNVAPLSCLFIIAEEFLSKLDPQHSSKEDFLKVYTKMEKDFNHGNYRKPFKGLHKLLGI